MRYFQVKEHILFLLHIKLLGSFFLLPLFNQGELSMTQTSALMMKVASVSNLATEEDIQELVDYMSSLRRVGVIPSDVIRKGLDYAELWVQETYPGTRQIIRMKLSIYILEKAALEVGVHAESKRQQRLEEKNKK